MASYADYYGIVLPDESDVATGVEYGWAGTEFTGTMSGGGGGSGDALEATSQAILAHLLLMKGSTFDTATDSLEAIRNRGDAAWGTATGFATSTQATDAKAILDMFATMIVLDGSVYQYTTNALELGPAGSGATVDEMVAALSAITPATVRNWDPVTKAVFLVRDDDYLEENGREILIPVNIPDGIDADSAVYFGATHNSVTSRIDRAASLVLVGDEWNVKLQFDAEDTTGKQLGQYAYDVKAVVTSSGNKATILRGNLTLFLDIAQVPTT